MVFGNLGELRPEYGAHSFAVGVSAPAKAGVYRIQLRRLSDPKEPQQAFGEGIMTVTAAVE